jgi:hypothetical protein
MADEKDDLIELEEPETGSDADLDGNQIWLRGLWLLADFGKDLGKWMSDVAQFQTGSSEEKPFPWKKWG